MVCVGYCIGRVVGCMIVSIWSTNKCNSNLKHFVCCRCVHEWGRQAVARSPLAIAAVTTEWQRHSQRRRGGSSARGAERNPVRVAAAEAHGRAAQGSLCVAVGAIHAHPDGVCVLFVLLPVRCVYVCVYSCVYIFMCVLCCVVGCFG
jgi:hypothetical protein